MAQQQAKIYAAALLVYLNNPPLNSQADFVQWESLNNLDNIIQQLEYWMDTLSSALHSDLNKP